jgi:hypothetical protein
MRPGSFRGESGPDLPFFAVVETILFDHGFEILESFEKKIVPLFDEV